MKFTLKFLLICICYLLINSSQTIVYQAIWYNSKDDSVSPAKHNLALRNFANQYELGIFILEDTSISSNFVMVKRNGQYEGEVFTDVDINSISGSPSEFSKHFAHYFPNFSLNDPRKGYYVIHAQDETNFVKYCETYFSIKYFQNFKSAKLEFENTKISNPLYKLIFGSSDGIIESFDSTNLTKTSPYFLEAFYKPTCTTEFGIIQLTPNTTTKLKITLGAPNTQEHLDFPLNAASNTVVSNCDIVGVAVNEFYIPERFGGHCKQYTVTPETYTICSNDSSDLTESLSIDVEFDSYCNYNEKIYMKTIRPITQ